MNINGIKGEDDGTYKSNGNSNGKRRKEESERKLDVVQKQKAKVKVKKTEKNVDEEEKGSNYVRRPRLIPRRLLEAVGRGVSLVKEGGVEGGFEKAEEVQKEGKTRKDYSTTRPTVERVLNGGTISKALKDTRLENKESINEIFGGRSEYQVVYKSKEESDTKKKTPKQPKKQYNANFKEAAANEIKTSPSSVVVSPSNSVVVRPRGGGSEDFFDTARLKKLQQLAKKAEKDKEDKILGQKKREKSSDLRNLQDGPRLQFGFQPLTSEGENQDLDPKSPIYGGVREEESRSRGSVWREKLAAKLTSPRGWDEHSLPWGSTSSSLPPSSPSSSSSSLTPSSSSSLLSDFIEELDTLQAPGGVRQPRASPRSSPSNLPSHLSPLSSSSPSKKFSPSSPLPTTVWSHQQDLKSNKQFLGVFDTRPYFYIPPPNLREQKVLPRRDTSRQKQNRRSDKPPPRLKNIFAKIVNFWTDTSHVRE